MATLKRQFMDKFVINGGNRLKGTVQVSGAKNAALPIMAAAMLADGPSVIGGVPDLADIRAMCRPAGRPGRAVTRDAQRRAAHRASRTRATATPRTTSSARCGPASACWARCWPSAQQGPRVDARRLRHRRRARSTCTCAACRRLGAEIDLDGGDIVATAKRLHGAEIFLGGPFGSTVLGTANVMMAAALAEGTTVIESAACEPEVVDLADFLNAMGGADHRRTARRGSSSRASRSCTAASTR